MWCSSRPTTRAAASGRCVTGSTSTPSTPSWPARQAESRSNAVGTGRGGSPCAADRAAAPPAPGTRRPRPSCRRGHRRRRPRGSPPWGTARRSGRRNRHPVVEEDAGVDHRPHQRLVCLGRPEEVGGPRRRPAHPELRAIRRVPGVAPVRERRVGRQRQHDGEPAADPVDDRHVLLRRGDAYVDVAPAGQHLLGRRPEPLGHPQVPRLGRDEAGPGQRRSPEGRRPRSGLAARARPCAASHEARARRRRGRCTRRTESRPCSAAARPRSHPRGRRRPAVARPRRR